MVDVQSEKDHYRAQFERLETSLFANDPPWLSSLRKAAISRFLELGFPTHRDEEWKYLNLSDLSKVPFTNTQTLPSEAQSTIDESRIRAHFLGDVNARIVFIDGTYSSRLSNVPTDSGVSVKSLSEAASTEPELEKHFGQHAPWQEHAFVALNTAMTHDGAVIRIAKGHDAPSPIHLVFLHEGSTDHSAVYPRVLVQVGEGARASLIETFASLDNRITMTNAVTEVLVDANAELTHYKVQEEGDRSFYVSNVAAHVKRDARYKILTASFGAQTSRHEITATFEDRGGECTLDGVYLVDGERRVDHRTMIDHAHPHCRSFETYKGVLAGHATGAFNGKILVRPHAQKTDAEQSSQSLLLTDTAEINSKPQLEIYADDVRCTHGATTGQLREDALFYLRSRGISEETARDMLIHAFLSDIVSHVSLDSLRERLETTLTKHLRSFENKRGAQS